MKHINDTTEVEFENSISSVKAYVSCEMRDELMRSWLKKYAVIQKIIDSDLTLLPVLSEKKSLEVAADTASSTVMSFQGPVFDGRNTRTISTTTSSLQNCNI